MNSIIMNLELQGKFQRNMLFFKIVSCVTQSLGQVKGQVSKTKEGDV